jgi:hypothetical protein
MPPSPPANTFDPDVPQTVCKWLVVPLVMLLHVLPL